MSSFFFDKDIDFTTIEEGKTDRKIKAYNGKLMAVEMYFKNGAQGVAEHSHPHEQISYCLEGEMEFFVGQERKIITPGDTVYVPSNVPHGFILKSPTGRVCEFFTPVREDFLKK
jgi:quercetin dioxygenase-like cupin family protein